MNAERLFGLLIQALTVVLLVVAIVVLAGLVD